MEVHVLICVEYAVCGLNAGIESYPCRFDGSNGKVERQHVGK